jgi:hypothetical protein
MIVSPGREASWTLARLLNGAAALPFPTAVPVALTYHVWPSALAEFVAPMMTAATVAAIGGAETAMRINRAQRAR